MHALIVNEQGVAVRAEGDVLTVRRGAQRLRQARIKEIDQVILLGRVDITSGAMNLLLRHHVDLVLLTQQGEFRGRLAGRMSRNVTLRVAQYRYATDPALSARIAAPIVEAKIRHQRQLLVRAQRQLSDDALAVAVGNLRLVAERAKRTSGIDELRGVEGHAAAIYFSQFPKLIRNDGFSFRGRNRRPPRDPINALLSFGYAVLGSLIESDIYRCGLDPMLGFLHQPAYGRPSLMLDLLEEFRPLIDGLVLRVVNRRQIGPRDFNTVSGASLAALLQDDSTPELESPVDVARPEPSGSLDNSMDDRSTDPRTSPSAADGGVKPDECSPKYAVLLSDIGRRIFLNEFFRRMRETLFYPPRAANFELRDIIREQVYHVGRVVEGTDDEYSPFVPA